jgi:hypothetical protein
VSGDAHFGSHQTPNAAIKSGTCHKIKFARNAPATHRERIRSAGSQKINPRARVTSFFMRVRKRELRVLYFTRGFCGVWSVSCWHTGPILFLILSIYRMQRYLYTLEIEWRAFFHSREKNMLARSKRFLRLLVVAFTASKVKNQFPVEKLVGEIPISSTCCRKSNWFQAPHFHFHATWKILKKYPRLTCSNIVFPRNYFIFNMADVFTTKYYVFFNIQFQEQCY